MKYKFGTETKTLDDGREVRRIIAAKDFGNVRCGTLGGFIEDTCNLSPHGNCWVADNAVVAGQGRVTGNAVLRDTAYVDDYAMVTDDALIEGNVQLLGDCFVYERARVGENTILAGACTICGNAIVRCQTRRSLTGKTIQPNVSGIAVVRENAVLEGKVCLLDRCLVEGNASVRGNARLADNVYVGGFAVVEGVVSLSDSVTIIERAKIGGRSKIDGRAVVRGDSVVRGQSLILCNAYIYGKAVLENATISGDERCNYEIINKRRLKPSTAIYEHKKVFYKIPALSPRQDAVKVR